MIFSGTTGGYFYFKFISSDGPEDSQVAYSQSLSSDIFILLTFKILIWLAIVFIIALVCAVLLSSFNALIDCTDQMLG